MEHSFDRLALVANGVVAGGSESQCLHELGIYIIWNILCQLARAQQCMQCMQCFARFILLLLQNIYQVVH